MVVLLATSVLTETSAVKFPSPGDVYVHMSIANTAELALDPSYSTDSALFVYLLHLSHNNPEGGRTPAFTPSSLSLEYNRSHIIACLDTQTQKTPHCVHYPKTHGCPQGALCYDFCCRGP